MRDMFLGILIIISCFLFHSQSALAQTPDISCIARDYKTPNNKNYESYLRTVTGVDGKLINYRPTGYYNKSGIPWQNFVKNALERYRERDLFCIVGANVTAEELRPILATQGGTATLLVPQDFKLTLALDAPDLVLPPTKDGPQFNQNFIQDLKNTIQKSILIPNNHCFNLGSADAEEDCFERMIDLGLKARNDVHKFYSTYEAKYTSPPSGDINIIKQNPDFPGQAFAEFVATVSLQESVMAPLYRQGTSGSVTWVGNTEQRKEISARSWLLESIVDQMSKASLRNATTLINLAANDNTLIETVKDHDFTDAQPLSIGSPADWYSNDLLHAICNPIFADALALASNKYTTFQIEARRPTSCGSVDISGRNIYRYATGLDIDPAAVRADLERTVDSTLVERLEIAIAQLRISVLDQSILINDVKRLIGVGQFDQKEKDLRTALAKAEAAAKEASGFGKVVKFVSTVGSIVTSVDGMVKGFEGLNKIFGGLSGNLGAQVDMLWDERKNLKKHASSIAKGYSKAAKGVDTLDKLINGQDQSQIEKIKSAIKILKEQRKIFLAEVNDTFEKVSKTRTELDTEIARKAVALGQERLSFNASKVVSMNLLANYSRVDGGLDAAQCARLFAIEANNPGQVSPAEINSTCLSPPIEYERRRDCIANLGDETGSLWLTWGGIAAYIGPKAAANCL